MQFSVKFTVDKVTSLKTRTFIDKADKHFHQKHKVKEGLAFSTISAQMGH